MQGTEFKADDVRVSDKHCMGCESYAYHHQQKRRQRALI